LRSPEAPLDRAEIAAQAGVCASQAACPPERLLECALHALQLGASAIEPLSPLAAQQLDSLQLGLDLRTGLRTAIVEPGPDGDADAQERNDGEYPCGRQPGTLADISHQASCSATATPSCLIGRRLGRPSASRA
jgi:hypothetical protein